MSAPIQIALNGFGLAVLATAFVGGMVVLGLMAARLHKANAKIKRLEASRKILEAQKQELAEAHAAMELRMTAMAATQADIIRRGRLSQLGQLIATVAHEIRNPLGALRISAYLLKRKLPSASEDCTALLERMDGGINRCDAIITQLLDYASDSKLNLETDDIHAWMGHLLAEQASKISPLISLKLIMAEGGLEASFDHLRLRRAVINLISNAADALASQPEDETVTKQIEVEIQSTPRGVEIAVRDTGPGIPPDLMEKVGEPFFTTKSFGTGLGVASSLKVAELHGGSLELSSDGNGTHARIWFPQAQAAALAA